MDAPLRYGFSLLALLAVAIGLPLAAALLRDQRPLRSPAASAAAFSAAELAAMTPAIARRVEGLRELSFAEIPRPEVVSPAQLADILRSQQRRPNVARSTREEETVLKLLGLLEPAVDLDAIAAGSADLVAGAYDPRTDRLLIVAGPGLGSGAIAEITLAHELAHALEDQRFGLAELDRLSGDRAIAAQAFVEGSATSLMVDYARRHLDLADLLGALGDPEVIGDDGFDELPPVLQRQLLFSYLRGLRLIDALRAAGGDWDLVDIGYRSRLPRSTEQAMHSVSYLRDEAPIPTRPAPAPGRGWLAAGSGVLGEFGTQQLLEADSDGGEARRAAAGWGGDRYRLWRRAGPGDLTCAAGCRSRFALALRWRWDRIRDAREFTAAARRFVTGTLEGRPAKPGLWLLDPGAVALGRRGDSTALAIAPTPRLALATANR